MIQRLLTATDASLVSNKDPTRILNSDVAITPHFQGERSVSVTPVSDSPAPTSCPLPSSMFRVVSTLQSKRLSSAYHTTSALRTVWLLDEIWLLQLMIHLFRNHLGSLSLKTGTLSRRGQVGASNLTSVTQRQWKQRGILQRV